MTCSKYLTNFKLEVTGRSNRVFRMEKKPLPTNRNVKKFLFGQLSLPPPPSPISCSVSSDKARLIGLGGPWAKIYHLCSGVLPEKTSVCVPPTIELLWSVPTTAVHPAPLTRPTLHRLYVLHWKIYVAGCSENLTGGLLTESDWGVAARIWLKGCCRNLIGGLLQESVRGVAARTWLSVVDRTLIVELLLEADL